jgi:hypothetical protein
MDNNYRAIFNVFRKTSRLPVINSKNFYILQNSRFLFSIERKNKALVKSPALKNERPARAQVTRRAHSLKTLNSHSPCGRLAPVWAPPSKTASCPSPFLYLKLFCKLSAAPWWHRALANDPILFLAIEPGLISPVLQRVYTYI